MKSSKGGKTETSPKLEREGDVPLSSREEALAFVPVKNQEIEQTRLESGDVILEYPATVRPFILKIMRRMGRKDPPIHKKKLQLDVLGTATWDMIDGERTVGQLVRTFADQYSLLPKEAETAVTQFIRELGKRGLIGLR